MADWRDAEELAAWHMRTQLALPDAALTNSGADGGLDVIANDAAAQVKHYAGQVGSPEVQRLVGAGHRAATRLFYAQEGFTAAAIDYGDAAGVALFTYNVYGDVHPANVIAERLVDAAQPEEARLAREREVEEAEAARHQQAATRLANLDHIAHSIASAVLAVESQRLRTHLPSVFVMAELAVQLAYSAAASEHLTSYHDQLREAMSMEPNHALGIPLMDNHARLDVDIARGMSEGSGQPASWWIPQLHSWNKRREALMNGPEDDQYAWLDRLDEDGTVRRWVPSMAADRGYLGIQPWPQVGFVTEVVAERLVVLDPLQKGPGWCKGALWHLNRDLPWARYAGIDDRFHDELIPDVEDWRSVFHLDDPPTGAMGGSPLWL